jgi:hypothetical protein
MTSSKWSILVLASIPSLLVVFTALRTKVTITTVLCYGCPARAATLL